MIIFGTRGISSTHERGEFLCPQCESSQHYKLKSTRRFFTLYFIPLIPLDKLGEYVECQNCKGTFIPKVLTMAKQPDAEEFYAEYEKAMRHCMIKMMLADGEIDVNERRMVIEIINQFGHHDIDDNELDVLIGIAERDTKSVIEYLRGINGQLNNHGREMIIKCGMTVATSDGHVDDTEIELIKKMASALELTPTHIKGIISEIMTPNNEFSSN